jgi:hypothetical protein
VIIELLDEQVEVEPSSLVGEQLHTLLAGAIFNPYGPTIVACCSVVSGDDLGSTDRLYYLSINPFKQYVARIGVVDYSEGVDAQSLASLHGAFNCSCPSLAFTTFLLEPADSRIALKQWIASFDDAENTWSFIKKHKYDPWGRASAEQDEGFNQAIAGQEPRKKSSGFLSNFFARKGRASEDWLDEFTSHLEDPRHQKTEQMCFYQAWEGSIEHAPGGQMMKNLQVNIVSMDEMLREWFIPIMLSCRVSDGFFGRQDT